MITKIITLKSRREVRVDRVLKEVKYVAEGCDESLIILASCWKGPG